MMKSSKHILGVAAVLLGLSASPALAHHHLEGLQIAQAAPTAETNQMLKFEKIVHDFGVVEEGEVVKVTFPFTNVGGETIRIEDVKASCGCTAAKAGNKKEYAPGEGSEIEASFNTARRSGKQTKTITIRTSDPNTPSYQVRLTGDVVSKVYLDSLAINFDNIRQGEGKSMVVNLIDLMDEPIEIKSIETGSDDIEAEILPYSSYQEEKLGLSGRKVPIRLTASKTLPMGMLSSEMRIETNSSVKPTLRSRLIGRVVGDVNISPQQVYFGIVEPDKKVTKRLRVTVTPTPGSNVDREFKLAATNLVHDTLPSYTGASGAEPNFDISVDGKKSGLMHQEMQVTFTAPEAYGRYQGTIVLTGMIDEKETSVSVPYTAFVRQAPKPPQKTSNKAETKDKTTAALK